MHSTTPLLLIAACAALGACSRSTDTPTPVPAPVLSTSPGSWVGRWQGPEGTFLDIRGGPGTYDVTASAFGY